LAVWITKNDLAWSYLGYFINFGTNLIILPFVIKFLSVEELGLWYTFLGIGNVVILLDFGFSFTITRNITYCWSGAQTLSKNSLPEEIGANNAPNFELLSKVILTCKIIYLVVSLVALLLLLSAGTIYIANVTRNFHGTSHLIAWFIYSVSIFISLYFGYFDSFMYGVGAISQNNQAKVIARLTQIVCSVAGLFWGWGIEAVAASYLVSGFVFRMLASHLFYKYKNIRQEIRIYRAPITGFNLTIIFRQIWFNAWRSGVQSLGNYLILQSNTLICSYFIGLRATALYGLALQIVTFTALLSKIVANTYQAALTEAVIKKARERVKRILATALAVYWGSYLILTMAVITIGIPVLKIIKPNLEISVPIFLFMAWYAFFENNQSIFCLYISASNRIPFMTPTLLSGLAIVIFSYILVKEMKLGIWGLLLSQSIVQLSYNNWKWPFLAMKELQINLAEILEIGMKAIYADLFCSKERKEV
jgi:O-antigen/teichoic acid export membrane protein